MAAMPELFKADYVKPTEWPDRNMDVDTMDTPTVQSLRKIAYMKHRLPSNQAMQRTAGRSAF